MNYAKNFIKKVYNCSCVKYFSRSSYNEAIFTMLLANGKMAPK